jgi:hypothetical protein
MYLKVTKYFSLCIKTSGDLDINYVLDVDRAIDCDYKKLDLGHCVFLRCNSYHIVLLEISLMDCIFTSRNQVTLTQNTN